MNIYIGKQSGREVTVNDKTLDPRFDISNHSLDGFSWGFEGSGPAQLALAMMIREFGEDITKHPKPYQEFKRDIIARFPQDRDFKWNSKLFQDWATTDPTVMMFAGLFADILRDHAQQLITTPDGPDGYTYFRVYPNGRSAAIVRFLFSSAIVDNIQGYGMTLTYQNRWCYKSYVDAIGALNDWDGEGEPEGWHRHLPSHRRRDEKGKEEIRA